LRAGHVDPIEAAALEAHRQQMMDELDIPRLKRAFRFAAIAACSLTFILIFAIPLPLFFSSHSESRSHVLLFLACQVNVRQD
jgi:hypothetical protein